MVMDPDAKDEYASEMESLLGEIRAVVTNIRIGSESACRRTTKMIDEFNERWRFH